MNATDRRVGAGNRPMGVANKGQGFKAVTPIADPPIRRDGAALGSRISVVDGIITCSTTDEAKAGPKALLEALMGDWSRWWALGSTSNRRVSEKAVAFDFMPLSLAGMGMVTAGVELGAPIVSRTAAGAERIRVPLALSKDLIGHGYFEFEAKAGGGSILRAVWEKVRPTGLKSLGPMPRILGEAHLIVESAYLKALDAYAAKLPRMIR